MRAVDLSNLTWRKSSYSNSEGGACLEVADHHPTLLPVRDSKDPDRGVLAFSPEVWNRFVRAYRSTST